MGVLSEQYQMNKHAATKKTREPALSTRTVMAQKDIQMRPAT